MKATPATYPPDREYTTRNRRNGLRVTADPNGISIEAWHDTVMRWQPVKLSWTELTAMERQARIASAASG